MGDFLPYTDDGDILLDPLGTMVSLAVLVVLALAVSRSRTPRDLKRVLYLAIALRGAGALARYMILFGIYGGSGDARLYYRGGLIYAGELWKLNPGPLFNPINWQGGIWHGTQFVYFPAAFVTAFTGPSMLGAFIIFSLFAFAGLYGFLVAFRRSYPHVSAARYARWLFFFPALWYWPSSIGKEAIVLLGLGICIAGYIGRSERINWPLFLAGLFLIYGVRPQVLVVVLASLIAGHGLSLLSHRWTPRHILQAVALAAAAVVGVGVAMQAEGVESFSVEGVQGYIEEEGARELGGESAIAPVEIGVAGAPVALINVLLRPFPWEAHNPMALFASLQMIGFWAIVWVRRRQFVQVLRHWRSDRLIRVAIPFVLLYSLALGFVVANMGLIDRQRIFIFPFLFLLAEAAPVSRIRTAPVVRRAWTREPRRRRAEAAEQSST